MSSETPSGPPAEDRPTEPFSRGRIVWSRPPQSVFRVGPLPRVAPGPAARPVRGSGAGILTGSMIPQARAASPPAEAPVEPVVEALAPQPESVVEPVAAEPEPVAPEPEPVVAEFEPVAEPVQSAPWPAPQEMVIEPETPEPAVTLPPPLSTEAKPAARPRELPSVVVTPAIYASVGAAMQTVTRGDRWPIVAGIAALAVIGGFIWLATLPAPQPVAPAPIPAAPAPAEPVSTAPQPLDQGR